MVSGEWLLLKKNNKDSGVRNFSYEVSSVQNPGWLFDIGDDTTQLYGDYFISQYKDPFINQSVFHGMSRCSSVTKT